MPEAEDRITVTDTVGFRKEDLHDVHANVNPNDAEEKIYFFIVLIK